MELSNKYRRKKYPAEIAVKPPVEKIPTKPPEIIPDRSSGVLKDKRKWASTEATISFDFNDLVDKVKVHIKTHFSELSSEEITQKIGINLSVFTINEQKFGFTSTPNNFGGVRWFVLCPKCGRKSQKLYLPKNKDREPVYLCRRCYKLKPNSLLLGNQKMYTDVAKPLKKLEQIKKKLLKKRLISRDTEELLAEYARIEKKLANSPEYRLWIFKKEHGRDP